jgi:hypothetical protein
VGLTGSNVLPNYLSKRSSHLMQCNSVGGVSTVIGMFVVSFLCFALFYFVSRMRFLLFMGLKCRRVGVLGKLVEKDTHNG